MTLNSYTDCTQQYETTLDDCTCKGFTRWNHCKHVETLQRAYARAKAETFAELRRQFDCRLNGQADTQRCYYEMSLGA
jgi:hypothetical protein